MNGLNNLDETEYSLDSTDDPIRFWRSKVTGQGDGRPSRWRSPSCFSDVTVEYLCLYRVSLSMESKVR